MAFDFKKEYREFYLPKNRPEIVDVPEMRFLAVRGQGDPNTPGGAYQAAIGLLYSLAFTIKMSPRAGYEIDGYFEYVVPPLEGFWWMDGVQGVDYARKQDFHWISAIRLPDFVSRTDFDWAVSRATEKKKLDFSPVEFFTYREGPCVQCMHVGPFDDEPATVAQMEKYAVESGHMVDITYKRPHHEIYLSDFRRVEPQKYRTVIRHPVIKFT